MDYLKLRSQGLSCVLPLPVVEELINLPELATIPEAPVDIIDPRWLNYSRKSCN